jgi:hypothetical protein
MNLAFRYNIIEKFIPIISDQSKTLIGILKQNSADKGKEFDIGPQLSSATLDVIYGKRSQKSN